MVLRKLARLTAAGASLEEAGRELGMSVETLQLLTSSDAFKALEREEVIRGVVGGHDG